MKVLLAIMSFLTSLLSYASTKKDHLFQRVPSIKLPMNDIVVGSQDNKAINVPMSGVTSIDFTGEVKFSEKGKEEIKKICSDLLNEDL